MEAAPSNPGAGADSTHQTRHVHIPAGEPPQPTEKEMDLDREIEHAFDADEPMAGRAPSGDVE